MQGTNPYREYDDPPRRPCPSLLSPSLSERPSCAPPPVKARVTPRRRRYVNTYERVYAADTGTKKRA
eukprot:26066-Eustigmatos_ZCMA.PRE.1